MFVLLMLNFILLIWFGMASILILILGIVHEWITSDDDKIIIIWLLIGIINLLSVSIKLKLNICLKIKYELNLILNCK